MTKLLVEVYAQKNCSLCGIADRLNCALCKEAKEIIGKVNEEIPFQFKEIDICSSEDLYRRYKEDIPTIFINGKKAFKYKVDENEFRKRIRKEIIKAGLLKLWNKKQHYS
jgi:glutaredoxin